MKSGLNLSRNFNERDSGPAREQSCLYYIGFNNEIPHLNTFPYRFPKNLAYKLHQRRGQCQTKLGRFKDAQMSFCEAVAALEFVPKLSPKKKDSLVRDINALSKESESAMNCQISTGT